MSTITASTTSSILSALNLGATFDPTTIINSLVTAENAPITALQTQETANSSASTTLTSFVSTLSALQTAASTLADPTQFAALAASSSSSSVVATATTGATAGSHTVQVTALAQGQTTFSNPESSSTAGLGMSGSIGMTINGKPFSVPVANTDSLAAIAANISSSGAGVTASVVFDGSQYRLQVQGGTGAANAISFNESGTSLGLATKANTYQAAQNAAATIDGIAVTSPTNQMTGAIAGVTLALTSTTSSPTTVTVQSSSTALTTNIQSFVSAYNATVAAGHAAAGYGTTAASVAGLQSDPGIESTLHQMSALIASLVPNADSTVRTLGDVGITLGNDGTLTLDSSKLTSALATDPTGVERLFVTDPSTGATGVMSTLSTMVTSQATNKGSALQSEISMYQTRNTSLATQVTSMQARVATYQTQLQTEFSNMDQTVNTERSLYQEVGGSGTFM
jgi:flagellar hook-associated protein 2